MEFKPLANPERSGHDFTHMGVITANDLTQATANTAQSFNMAAIPTDSVLEKVEIRLVAPFQNTADAAFNSTTVDVGDTGSATRFFTAKQVNLNGAYITAQQFSNTAVGPYAASQNLTVNVNSMAAKSLSALNRGELHVFVKLTNPKQLSDLKLAIVQTK